MAGKIFYRERLKVQDGAKTPRFRVVAVTGVDLKVYGDHFRKSELQHLSEEVGAELVLLRSGSKHKTEKHE